MQNIVIPTCSKIAVLEFDIKLTYDNLELRERPKGKTRLRNLRRYLTMQNTLPSYMLTPRMLDNRARAAKRAERIETVKAIAGLFALAGLMLAAGYFCPPVSVSF